MNYRHLLSLTTQHGVHEHCDGHTPLPAHGYCVDDVARALIVVARDPRPPVEAERIIDIGLEFLAASQHVDGSIDNRMSIDGQWSGTTGVGDHWGRALWAWGTVVGRSCDLDRIERAVGAFRISSGSRSPFLRSMAHAALGAAEYLRRFPHNTAALDLLADARNHALRHRAAAIPWPEGGLTYANAVIPHAVILAGAHLAESTTVDHGLEMLEWLAQLQTRDGHLSPVGNHGWHPGERMPAFDQQPLEVSHFVDACLAAFEATSDPIWLERARMAALWFYGVNDIGVWMHEPKTGAGYDGLTPLGPNRNCGAESTLAYLATVGQLEAYGDELRAL
jgi:hypothetical protein